MPSVREFKADLDILDRSLIANNSGVIARGRLRLLRRAVDCFGFHLASLDMRQNSAVHERTDCRIARCRDARHVLSGAERRRADRAACERAAQCAAADFGLREIQRGDARRTRRVPCRRRSARQVRRRRDPPMHHLDVQGRLRHAGGRAAAEGGRAGRSVRPQRDQHRAAVRDHRGFAGLQRHHGPHACRCRNTAGWSTAAARCRK